MSILLTVVAAVAAVTLVTHYNNQSATALGKVGAMIGATTVIADAWSKVAGISRRLSENPTALNLPSVSVGSTSREVAVPPRRSELDEFFDEHPSMALDKPFRTGGIRGYSAYDPPSR